MSPLYRYLFILLVAAGSAGITLSAKAAFPVSPRLELKAAVAARTDDEQLMLRNRTVMDRMFYQSKTGNSPAKDNFSLFLVLGGAAIIIPCLGFFSVKTKWRGVRS